MYAPDRPIAFLSDDATSLDERRFGATAGLPDFNTLWEGLAVLVALRAWSERFSDDTPIEVRSDNLPVLFALAKWSAAAPELNTIVQEISLICVTRDLPICGLSHIPGVTNVTADALSRLRAPEPKPFPSELRDVPRTPVAARDASFYATTRAAGKRASVACSSH